VERRNKQRNNGQETKEENRDRKNTFKINKFNFKALNNLIKPRIHLVQLPVIIVWPLKLSSLCTDFEVLVNFSQKLTISSIIKQTNLTHTLAPHFTKYILIFPLLLGIPLGVFLPDFPTKIVYIFLISPMLTVCPANIIFFRY
jgi:hypothetical protein